MLAVDFVQLARKYARYRDRSFDWTAKVGMGRVRARAVEATARPYCGVGCGLLVTPDGRGGARVRGDTDHPANFG